ncbi:MAG: response regulator transcription factor [Chitinophagaceae bacterium]|nr:response regulator transcription factor [Chitinophagaceae bacterium]
MCYFRMMKKIAIVDDNLVNRKTIRRNIDTQFEIVFEAVNGREFLEKMKKIPEEKSPQLVLMDVDMPVMNGIEAIAIGTLKYPNLKFLVLTIFDDDEKIFEAIQAGASGYLLKEEDSKFLCEAINNAIEYNGVPMSPAIARKTLEWVKATPRPDNTIKPAADEAVLSEREIEILRLIAKGLDYKKIAERLFISPLTVRTHTSKIYYKLHVNSKAQAIQIAHKLKWI